MKMIEVKFKPSDKTVTCEAGVEIETLLEHFSMPKTEIAAVMVNNQLQPLSARLDTASCLQPVPLACPQGALVYRHTLAYILHYAAQEFLPNRTLHVEHSLGNAYYYTFLDGNAVSEEEIGILKAKSQDLITKNIPITRHSINYEEAIEYFERKNQAGTLELLKQRARAKVKVNQCGDFIDLYVTPLCASTGMIAAFDIILYSSGFLLTFPVPENPKKIIKFEDNPKIFSIYSEYKKWGRIVGVHSAHQINSLIASREIRDFIRISEEFQSKKLMDIAESIDNRRNDVRLVLLAGPSSSGKTTTAKRLSIKLNLLGINPILVSLDDYYLPPSKAPKDEYGKPDLECLEALDIPYLNQQLLALFNGDEVTLPSYDFRSNTRFEGKKIKLDNKRQVLLMEGIHGLNDALTPQIQKESKFKIYVSALTQLNIDEHNRVSTTDNRLLRRMVRDSQFRGMGAARTINMWPSVQRGAEKYIFKFQNTADEIFNSALDYEIAVLKYYAEPLLLGVKPNMDEYSESSRLLNFLENFSPIPPQYVPSISILREFIGGSEFKY